MSALPPTTVTFIMYTQRKRAYQVARLQFNSMPLYLKTTTKLTTSH